MTFNPNAQIDPSKVSRRGRNTAIGVGGGGVVVLVLFLLSQFLGVDLTGLAGGDSRVAARSRRSRSSTARPARLPTPTRTA